MRWEAEAPPAVRERIAELALALCAIPSVTGDERAIADYLEAWARTRFAGEVVRRGNALCAAAGGPPGRPVVALVGHLDTVPPVPADGAPRIVGDRLIGRGSSDMKGALAVAMALAETLDLARLPVRLALAFYDREEGPYAESGLPRLLEALGAQGKIDLAIALEPTDNVVQLGCVGSLHARLTFRGRAAHSARPWQGENAVHKAGELLWELRRLAPREVQVQGLIYREVMSVTLAEGGRARNVVPDAFTLNLNYRFAPGRSLAEAEGELARFVNGRAEVEIVDRAPAGPVCQGNVLLGRLLSVTGAELAPKQAWTDVARLGEAGIDAVNFGPGDTAQAHQAGESASLPRHAVGYAMLRAFLEAPG